MRRTALAALVVALPVLLFVPAAGAAGGSSATGTVISVTGGPDPLPGSPLHASLVRLNSDCADIVSVTGFDYTAGCPGFDDPTPTGGAIVLMASSGTGTVTFASPQTVLLSWSDGGSATADGAPVEPNAAGLDLSGFVTSFFDVARSIYTVVGPAFLGLSVAALGVALVLRWTRSIRSTV